MFADRGRGVGFPANGMIRECVQVRAVFKTMRKTVDRPSDIAVMGLCALRSLRPRKE